MKRKTRFIKRIQKGFLYTLTVFVGINSAFAQWDGSSVNTYTTSGNLGIGLGPVYDAKLSIFNIDDPTGAASGGIITSGSALTGVKIQRNAYPLGGTFSSYPSANIFEIWKQDHDASGAAVGSNNNIFTIDGYGNVQAGKTAGSVSTADRLTVYNGSLSLVNDNDLVWRYITGHCQGGGMMIGPDVNPSTGVTTGPMIQMGAAQNGWRPGQIWYHSYAPQNTGWSQNFLNWNASLNKWVDLMGLVDDNGTPKVVIGDPVPNFSTSGKYSLYVANGILTERIKVAMQSTGDWSDFVFNKGYDLKPLKEVESYVKANKHLPGIPSAEEVVKDGVDVATMDAKLLQKVEELTLYVIQQDKKIEEQGKEIKMLKNKGAE